MEERYQLISSVQCNGANPESLLTVPVHASVEVPLYGTRRISCPYVVHLGNTNGTTTAVCQASAEGFRNAAKIRERLLKLKLRFNPERAITLAGEFNKQFRPCIQKYPI